MTQHGERRRRGKGDESRKENKRGARHSHLISALAASTGSCGAGSSHNNRQAIWLHYETRARTHTQTQTHTNSVGFFFLSAHAHACRRRYVQVQGGRGVWRVAWSDGWDGLARWSFPLLQGPPELAQLPRAYMDS